MIGYASIPYVLIIDSMKIISCTLRGDGKGLVPGSFHEVESQDGLNVCFLLAFSWFNVNRVCWHCNEFHRSELHHA